MSVPRQGVEPCFAQDEEMHARKTGEISHKGACWHVCRVPPWLKKRGEPHGWPRKPLKLQYTKKDVRPCVFRCERLHGCCKSQPTGGLPTASDTDKYLRWWVS